MVWILATLLIIAVVLVLAVVFLKRGKAKTGEIKISKPLFVAGLAIALFGAGVMFHGNVFGDSNSGIATVIGIVGISLIATSGFRKP